VGSVFWAWELPARALAGHPTSRVSGVHRQGEVGLAFRGRNRICFGHTLNTPLVTETLVDHTPSQLKHELIAGMC
jgi:hypothetical protein